MVSFRRLAGIVVLAGLCSCAPGSPGPEPGLTTAWRDYAAMPAERALAIAGDPGRKRWVTGASGGHSSSAAAERAALEHCRVRREARRMQEDCVLYAVGDEIVWRGR